MGGIGFRRAIVLGVILVAGAAVAGCGSSDGESTGTTSQSTTTSSGGALQTVRVGYIPAFGTLPIRVAVERGFFERNGIELDITEGPDPAPWTAALGKQFDLALSSPTPFLSAAVAGLPVQVVSGMQVVDAEHPNNVLISRDPIASVSELKGQTVGVIGLAGASYESVRYLLIKAGVDLADVRFVASPLPTQADQVKAGRLGAAVSASPFFTGVEEDGLTINEDVTVESMKQATGADSTMAAFMIASRQFLQDNPEAARGWRSAIEEAIAFIEENPDESRQILRTWLRLPDGVAENAPLPSYSVNESLEDLEGWSTIVRTTGLLRETPPAEELIWPEAVGPIS